MKPVRLLQQQQSIS